MQDRGDGKMGDWPDGGQIDDSVSGTLYYSVISYYHNFF